MDENRKKEHENGDTEQSDEKNHFSNFHCVSHNHPTEINDSVVFFLAVLCNVGMGFD